MNSLKPRYVIFPGYVQSKSDGQHHYLSALRLAFLYGVRLKDCEIYQPQNWWSERHYREAYERNIDAIHLVPRRDGNYTLPTHGIAGK